MAAFLSRRDTLSCAKAEFGDDNMKVVVRIRPENEEELKSSHSSVVKVLDEHVLVFDPRPDDSLAFNSTPGVLQTKRRHFLSKKYKDLGFAFNHVFDETASQQEVFEHTTRSIIDGVLDGINCSVFAYGATGAGKTYTMLGTNENPGIMFHTMMELYRRINELKDEKICHIAVSYSEIYNETIRDLIVPSGSLHLREDTEGGLVVNGLSRHCPSSAEEILRMLEAGNLNRTQHPTKANATSSRSHAVFQVFVHQKPRTSGLTAQVTTAKMSLIDLAGSERATMTTNTGERLREGANINKSLLALGNCINALAENKDKNVYVPYRDSKLTRLLKDSLGGNCRTVMIANISPSGINFEDTYNTLKYADRAKKIKTTLVRNVMDVDFHVTKYRTIVQDLQGEIAELKAKLDKKTPKRQAFDAAEAARLQGLIEGVYGERARLRKQMAELEASERETLLKVCRKERDIQRMCAISSNEARRAKTADRVVSLRQRVTEIQREKQNLNEYLSTNNETIVKVQGEVNSVCSGRSGSLALKQLLDSVTEARKFQAENTHHWKQTKLLLKYIKNQEKESAKTERILTSTLEIVKEQHTLLKSLNQLTPSLVDSYDMLVRMAEGFKGVAWADQSHLESGNLLDVSLSGLTQSQQTLFNSFLVQASPMHQSAQGNVRLSPYQESKVNGPSHHIEPQSTSRGATPTSNTLAKKVSAVTSSRNDRFVPAAGHTACTAIVKPLVPSRDYHSDNMKTLPITHTGMASPTNHNVPVRPSPFSHSSKLFSSRQPLSVATPKSASSLNLSHAKSIKFNGITHPNVYENSPLFNRQLQHRVPSASNLHLPNMNTPVHLSSSHSQLTASKQSLFKPTTPLLGKPRMPTPIDEYSSSSSCSTQRSILSNSKLGHGHISNGTVSDRHNVNSSYPSSLRANVSPHSQKTSQSGTVTSRSSYFTTTPQICGFDDNFASPHLSSQMSSGPAASSRSLSHSTTLLSRPISSPGRTSPRHLSELPQHITRLSSSSQSLASGSSSAFKRLGQLVSKPVPTGVGKGVQLPTTTRARNPVATNSNNKHKKLEEHDLNSTYTVGVSNGVRRPHTGEKEPDSISSVNVSAIRKRLEEQPNPLITVNVNTLAQSEEKRKIGGCQPDTQHQALQSDRRPPNYLQMTKSAASKRVFRLHNKENRGVKTGAFRKACAFRANLTNRQGSVMVQ